MPTKPRPSTRTAALLALAGASALLAAPAPVRAEKLLLLTADSRLLAVDSATSDQVLTNVPITGLPAGETLLGIDIRPRDGSLVGVSSASRLYNIAASTGVATVIGTAAFTPAINGTSVGFDFNPTVDRIRFTTDAGQNLRLNPDTGGTAAVDGTEAYASTDTNGRIAPRVVAAAYTGSGPNATATQLYVIDAAANVVALQNPPNNGTLTTVNPLGVTIDAVAGYDISNVTERGYAALSVGGVPALYSISTTAAPTPGTPVNAATRLGALPTGFTFTDLVAAPANVLRRQTAETVVAKGRALVQRFQVGAFGLGTTSGGPVRLLIRGLGPSFGSTGVADPALRLFREDGTLLANNNNYTASTDLAAINATGLAPANTSEAAILVTLQPGSYYVGLNAKRAGQEGTGRIEIIELD